MPESRKTHLFATLAILFFLHDVAVLAPLPALVCSASANGSQPEQSCNTFGPTYKHQTCEFLLYFLGHSIKAKQTRHRKEQIGQ